MSIDRILKINQRLIAAATIIIASLSIGCAPIKYTDYDAFIKRPTPVVGGKPYVIEPPDGLRISAPAAIEIHNVSTTVRPDGFITLDLLGDVFAAGKTPVQLAAEIEEKILKYYQDVNVQVEVTGFNSKFYYMAGETGAGPRSYTGRDNIFDAIMRGGLPRTSWPEKIVVLRPNEQGDLIRRMSINAKDMIELGDMKYNAVLEEGDIIFIPINPLAAVGVAVQNLLQPVQPVITAVSTPARVSTGLSTGTSAGTR